MDGFYMKWMNRKAMLERGQRLMAAEHRGMIEDEQLHVWFQRTLPRYASFGQSIHKQPTDVALVEQRFWSECEKWVIERYYGFDLASYE